MGIKPEGGHAVGEAGVLVLVGRGQESCDQQVVGGVLIGRCKKHIWTAPEVEDVRRYRVPDLYRRALGMTRKGQA